MQCEKKVKRKINPKSNQDLLKFQRPVYELKRNEEGKVSSIITKLMIQQKEKPEIGFLPRSHLLNQLDQFIPMLKKSNQQLIAADIKPEQMIDAKLQEVEDSSSSEEEQEENEMEDENKMEEEKPKTQFLSSCDEFEFNILTYPYLETKSQKGEEKKADVPQLSAQFKKVVEIVGQQQLGSEMQKLD